MLIVLFFSYCLITLNEQVEIDCKCNKKWRIGNRRLKIIGEDVVVLRTHSFLPAES